LKVEERNTPPPSSHRNGLGSTQELPGRLYRFFAYAIVNQCPEGRGCAATRSVRNMKTSIASTVLAFALCCGTVSLIGQAPQTPPKNPQGGGSGAVIGTGTGGTGAPAVPSDDLTARPAPYSAKNLEALYKRLDANGDGVVSRQEFLNGGNVFAAAFATPPARSTDATGQPGTTTPARQAPGETTPTNPR
jgi:hypothetical protein